MSSKYNLRSAACARVVLLALLLVIVPLAAFSQQPAQSSQSLRTRPLPPKRYSPARDFDMRHIALDLHFDWERERALGSATLSFAPLTDELSEVELDASNMTFTSVALSSGTALEFRPDTAREKLQIKLDRVYKRDVVITIVIVYHTNGPTRTSSNGSGGLTFIKPTADDPKRPRQIWSQGESEWNHHWFPCFDYPNDFTTSELAATVDSPLTVISNGRLVEKRSTPDGKVRFHWKMDQPHASYLTSIVVGEFATIEQSHKGVPIFSYVYANQLEEAKVTVARVPAMMRFFEEQTGVKYPNAKYGQSFVYGLNGGMENITATTMSDQTIHDARSELDRTEDSLLAHELAHSWFGNSVTCRSWSDLWLNESFATYMAGLWNEHQLSRDEFLYSNIKSHHESYFNAWKRGVRRPIVTKNYHEPDALFDVYSYAHGTAVLHMLRTWLGDQQWWRALNHYLRKHAHQPVETEELRIAIEETTGQPLEWFFDQWVYQMGHPIFRVTQDYDPVKRTLLLKVRQEQRPDSENGFPQTKYFQTPIEIEIGTANKTKVERVVIEPKEEQSFTFIVDSEPLLVNFDYQDTVINELIFAKPTNVLLYQLKNDKDVMGRLWALDQISSDEREKSVSSEDKKVIVDAISMALKNDSFWGVRLEAARALGRVAGKDGRVFLLSALNDKNARVRTAAVESLADDKDASLANIYVKTLSDQSYATVRAAALALGATRSDVAYGALRKLVDTPSWRDSIRASALDGLAKLGDPRALDLGLAYASGSNPKDVRLAALALLGAVGKDDPRVFPIVSKAFAVAVASGSATAADSIARALVQLGDQRTIIVFQSARSVTNKPEIHFLISQFEQQLRPKPTPQ